MALAVSLRTSHDTVEALSTSGPSILHSDRLNYTRGTLHAVTAHDDLIEDKLNPLTSRTQCRVKGIPATQRAMIGNRDLVNEEVQTQIVHLRKAIAQRQPKLMTRVLHVALIVAIVDHPLEVALVVSYLKRETILIFDWLFHMIYKYLGKMLLVKLG